MRSLLVERQARPWGAARRRPKASRPHAPPSSCVRVCCCTTYAYCIVVRNSHHNAYTLKLCRSARQVRGVSLLLADEPSGAGAPLAHKVATLLISARAHSRFSVVSTAVLAGVLLRFPICKHELINRAKREDVKRGKPRREGWTLCRRTLRSRTPRSRQARCAGLAALTVSCRESTSKMLLSCVGAVRALPLNTALR